MHSNTRATVYTQFRPKDLNPTWVANLLCLPAGLLHHSASGRRDTSDARYVNLFQPPGEGRDQNLALRVECPTEENVHR